MFKPGDLVMVVKPMPCCGATGDLGLSFTVDGVRALSADEGAMCGFCRAVLPEAPGALFVVSAGIWWFPNHLIKIDPPADMTDTETEKELTA